MKTWHKLAAAAVTLALGAGAAIATWTSHQVSEQLQAWTRAPSQQSDFQLRKLQHARGFLVSTGTAEVVMRSRCSDDAAEQAGLVMQVSYRVQHLPGVAGLNAFSWQAKPLGEAAQAFKALFGTEEALSGQGHLTWTQDIQSDLVLPAVSLAQGGGTIEASPSRGAITVGGQKVAFAWTVSEAQVRSDGFVARVQGLSFSMDLDNWHRGTGEAAFELRQLSTRDVTLEGLKLSSSTRENAGRLDSAVRNHLDRLVAGKQELKNLAFDVGMQGLHADSVEQLTRLFSQSCGVHRMTQDERQTLRAAMRTLLSHGMSLKVEQVKGESPQGSVAGELTVTLQPAPASGAIELARLLSSTGSVVLKGDLASPELQQMATALGWGRVEQGALSSSFVYDKGQLKVLDRSVDASGLLAMFAVADTVIVAVLEDRVPAALALREEVPAAPPLPEDNTEALEATDAEGVDAHPEEAEADHEAEVGSGDSV